MDGPVAGADPGRAEADARQAAVPGRLAALDERLAGLASGELFSGVVRLERGGRLLFERAYGIASRRWNMPVTAGMRFDTASITKLFTAVVVLQQVGAGALDLDASIHKYVPLDGTRVGRGVTLRHLLTHTSGIADDADEEAGESYEALWAARPNYSVTSTADFLPQFVHKEPVFAPGAGCRYCNVGYILLGLAVERMTGRAYRDVVATDVFARAGMDRSGFFDMRDAEPDVAEGWEPVPAGGWRRNIYSYPPIGSPDGGAHATAADLVRFMDAVRTGVLLPPDATAAMLTPQVLHHARGDGNAAVGEAAEVHYGFGLEFEVAADGHIRSMSKDGINTGASALLRHFPHEDATIAVLSNSEDGAWQPARMVTAVVLAGI